jgi:hypothetical protein
MQAVQVWASLGGIPQDTRLARMTQEGSFIMRHAAALFIAAVLATFMAGTAQAAESAAPMPCDSHTISELCW